MTTAAEQANRVYITHSGRLRAVAIGDAFGYVTTRSHKLTHACTFGHDHCASYTGGPCAKEIRDALTIRGSL